MRYQTLQRMNVLVVMILGIDESLWLLSPGDKHARRELMQTIAVIMAQARLQLLSPSRSVNGSFLVVMAATVSLLRKGAC
jgi:hypothetical protein